MAIITQNGLFGWEQIEELGDLSRLRLVLDHLPDEELMQQLEKRRERGRDDYPVRPTWNALIAGVVFQHGTAESLLRELKRNGQLRQVCGYDVTKGVEAVPSSAAFSRFMAGVMEQVQEVERMFERLVSRTTELLPQYGEGVAMDGKALPSWARGKREGASGKQEPGGRRDTDAKWGVHRYRGKHEDGSVWEKTKKWFGYTLHLVTDSVHELPVGYEVTTANASEVVKGREVLKRVKERHPEVVRRCEAVSADRGYDDVKLIEQVKTEWGASPIIDIRNCWQDGEETRVVKDNVVYDYRGTVSCVCLRSGKQREMAYGGYEKDRQTLKYLCPARHYEYECEGQERCPVGRSVRVALREDPRVFTPLPRSSYKWGRLYAKRTAAERVNSRLDVSFGFERHTIRGLKKMRTRVGVALVVMMAMAVGRIEENQAEGMRSLLRSA